MADFTKNINLTKPKADEKYSLKVVNGNSDILDTEISSISTKILAIGTKISSIGTKISSMSTKILAIGTKISLMSTKIFKMDAEILARVKYSEYMPMPIGTILSFASSTVPKGFLECDGAIISRTVYNKLFNIIRTTYGKGDDKTTFNIPDLRGVFLRGVDNKRGLDGGRIIGSYQADMYRWHRHTSQLSDGGYFSYSGGGGSRGINKPLGSDSWTSATGGNETRPKNVAITYCIKY